MITKAIVEQIVDPYNIRVRIPIIDRTSKSSIHTATENLNVATICTIGGCSPNLQVGDVVVVAVDDTLDENVVILGSCYRSAPSSTHSDIIHNELTVTVKCTLPEETTIGKVSAKELKQLTGAHDNLQLQLSSLLQRITALEQKLASLPGEQ